jgi:hypothetical protein
VALAGLLPVRLLAEQAGLTAGVSAVMRRSGYDMGQVLVDLGLTRLARGQAIGDFQALAHLDKLIGPMASTPTVAVAVEDRRSPFRCEPSQGADVSQHPQAPGGVPNVQALERSPRLIPAFTQQPGVRVLRESASADRC